jgi:hypothetical protein
MDIYEGLANGMTIIQVNNNNTLKKFIGAFVDDASQFINTNHKQQCVMLLKTLVSQDAKTWSGLLEAMSGKIEITKSFYYLLTWAWDKYGNPSPQENDQQDSDFQYITLVNEDGIEQKLDQRDVNKSHKTLGVYKTLSGNEKDHVAYLTEKSNNTAAAIINGQLNQRQA